MVMSFSPCPLLAIWPVQMPTCADALMPHKEWPESVSEATTEREGVTDPSPDDCLPEAGMGDDAGARPAQHAVERA